MCNKKSYNHKNHSKYLLKVHLVLVTKYRKSLLVDEVSDRSKQIVFEISKDQNWRIEIMETDKDHMHLLIDYEPKVSVLGIVRRIKQLSTNRIYKFYKSELKQHYWKENTFWSDGYFACSIGDASTQTILKYIREQG